MSQQKLQEQGNYQLDLKAEVHGPVCEPCLSMEAGGERVLNKHLKTQHFSLINSKGYYEEGVRNIGRNLGAIRTRYPFLEGIFRIFVMSMDICTKHL